MGRHHAGLSESDLVRPFLPQTVDAQGDDSLGSLAFRVASYNALSLAPERKTGEEGLAFRPARAALLADQLRQAGVHIAAIQEARTEEGQISTGEYFRFCSGADRGHFGIELWFRKDFEILSFPRETHGITFALQSFVVHHRDPRRLVVLFKQGSLRVVFAAFHAPHRGTDFATLSEWWATTEALLYRLSRGSLLVVGADCNASVGSLESCHLSHCGAEDQDDAGNLLHAFLKKCELWAPATWPAVQHGPTWTFAQRRNGALTRPDFVFLPMDWRTGVVSTWTDSGITAANLVLDHIATLADVRVKLQARRDTRPARRAGIDVSKLSLPESQPILRSVLQNAPRPSWDTSAHAHVAQVTAYLQDSLQKHFPRAKQRPRHPYLTEVAWDLQRQVSWLRHRLAAVKTAVRRHTLLGVFEAWRNSKAEPAPSGASAWLRDAHFAEALYGFRLGYFARALRARSKADRARYVEALAEDVQANKADAYTAVNRLLARRRKKPFAPNVLPGIEDANGVLCETPEKAMHRWREYFSAMEDGLEVDASCLCRAVIGGRPDAWPVPASLKVLPSPVDLRNAVLAAQRNKASGPDALPGELGLVCADELKSLLLPLALKLGLLGEEGLGHKSGALAWIYKGRGSQTACESFRGILLLSNLAKAIHRAFRPQIQRHFETSSSALQLGGRRGGSVLFGSHLMRSFLRYRKAQGLSSGVLFADVSAAYYSTLRDLAARHPAQEPRTRPTPLDPQPTQDDFLDIEYQLSQPSAMAQSDATPWLRAVTAVINNDTWMVLQGDQQIIQTRRGTRPGSAWADLTFGVLLRRIVQVRDECKRGLAGACGQAHIPWDGLRDWSSVQAPVDHAPLDDIIWADDVASCLEIDKAQDAKLCMGLEAGVLVDAFDSHALTLSFGPRKTAALISLRGQGARAAQRALYSGKPEITVLREQGGAVKLPVVDSYKHLGVMQAREGNVRPELCQRRAAAWTAFREGRTRLFRCRRVSVSRRGTLLNTLVLSKLFFGAGAWPPLNQRERQLIAGVLFSIYRSTLGVRHGEDQHLSVATACSLLGLPDCDTLIIVDRLKYLKQLILAAPDTLWAAIRQDPPYLASVREALHWLFARVRVTCALPDPLVDCQAWCQFIKDSPARFKGLIQRGRGLELCRITCYAALQAFHRALSSHGSCPVGVSAETAEHTFTEACIPCRRGFVSRAAWACHSSKLHGYRIAASVLAGSRGDTLCLACGKCFSRAARLRRHLLHSSACRVQWGSFELAEGCKAPALHDCMPPPTLEGLLAQCHEEYDPATFSKGLLDSLEVLTEPTAETVWDLVADFIEPLETLRVTLRMWRDRASPASHVQAVVEDVLLMLDPELICDTFCRPKVSHPIPVCCGDLPKPLTTPFPFVLTGGIGVYRLEPPPCPAFCYPFVGGAPLSAARRQTSYLEAACDILGMMVQQSLSSRVCLKASRQSLASIEPIPTWMLSAGFIVSEDGISSPED